MKLAFVFAAAAMLTTTPAAAAVTYTYDTLGRVATVTYDNGMEIIYTYDPAGNRTQVVTQTGP